VSQFQNIRSSRHKLANLADVLKAAIYPNTLYSPLSCEDYSLSEEASKTKKVIT